MPSPIKINPSHFPKINPAKIAKGDTNPAAKTQIIAKKINKEASKNKFDCFIWKKNSLLFLMKS